MPNRAARRRAMKTSELREQAVESLGQTPYIDLEADKDPTVVIRIWHPLLVDDPTQVRLERYNQNADLDRDKKGELIIPFRINGEIPEPANIRSARAILGDEEHARFVAAGGNSNDVQLAWNEMVRTHEEADDVLGDSDVIEAEDPK